MERAVIPKRFPAVDGDLIMSSAIDAGIGLFTNTRLPIGDKRQEYILGAFEQEGMEFALSPSG
jgi:hypothetical protein